MLYVRRPQHQSALESKMTISYDLWSEYSSICTVFHWLKGEVNLDKKWQSDDLFYIIPGNERNSPSFQPILSNFKKDIVIYLKNLLTFEYRQNSLIPLSMVVGVSDTTAICQQEWPIFLRSYD